MLFRNNLLRLYYKKGGFVMKLFFAPIMKKAIDFKCYYSHGVYSK